VPRPATEAHRMVTAPVRRVSRMDRARRGAVLLASCLAMSSAGVDVARADSSAFTVTAQSPTIRAGAVERLTISISALAMNNCFITAPGRSLSLYVGDVDQVQVAFVVRPDAAPGARHVVFQCDAEAPQELLLSVLPPLHRAPGTRAQIVQAPFRTSMHQVPLDAARAQARGAKWWDTIGAGYLATFANGQCTDWVSRKRPDIVQRIEIALYVARALRAPFPEVDWTARNWATLARAAGMTVSPIPVPGAVAVYQPGIDGADFPTGHVAYVESVDSGTRTFTTSDENWGAPYRMGSQTLPVDAKDGRLFIYPT
jgi:hypothetical protein